MKRFKNALADLFPLDMDKRLFVASFFAGVTMMAIPSFGPINISNPVLILSAYFLLKAIILAVLINYENSYYGQSSWLAQKLTLGPLSLVTGVVLVTQVHPVENDSIGSFCVGVGIGLIITGLLSLREGALLLREQSRERAEARRILNQEVEEARQGALSSMAMLVETVRQIEDENALLADLTSSLDDTDSAEKGRSDA